MTGQKLRVLSLNLWFDQLSAKHRMIAVARLVYDTKPHCILFQEITPPLLKTLLPLMLELGFEISQDNVDRIENQPYSEAMFLYTPMFAERKEQVYYRFDNTCMNRGLIVTKAVFGQQQRQIVFATSHLESEKQFSKERMQQLRWSFDKLHEHAGDCGWIFGGDMNLRTDDDVGELPEGVVDCWEAVGSPKEHEITWDTIQNTNLRAPYKLRMRLDRLYAYKATPLSFKTVGKEQISHGEGAEFMSDHWGLLSEFQV